MVRKKCLKCPYYHKADAEHGDDGCYYWLYGSGYGFNCYKTEQIIRWTQTIVSGVALIISVIALAIRLAK